MSRFFINRPIFATVLSLLIIVAGLVTMNILPIAQYPEITPPTVSVTAFYPGASAETIAETVGQPIEEQVNGVEDMLYMSSVSSSAGLYTLTVTFNLGVDIDMATVLVQNRVSIATSNLPSDVTRLGITTKKKSTSIVLFVSLKSTDPRYDGLYLSNYAQINIVNELSRVAGVGEVSLFGVDDYSMRIWMDPDKMNIRGVTPLDIMAALKEQNVEVSAGKVGGEPTVHAKPIYQYTLNVKGRLVKPEEFENIIVKTLGDGKFLRLGEIATIELGTKDYNIDAYLKGRPVAAISIYQLPAANALDISENIKAKMEELAKFFPKGMEYEITLDTTKFVEASIEQVYHTLFEAVILVLLVIMLFLQNWRAILIPTLTIPVSLIGTFAVMQLMGFSINTLTLFGLILAIGIVVDDAIIVVENVSRHLEKDPDLTPKEATIKAMDEVTGPVIGVVLVLLSVFIPTAFIGGITGELYKQFALTIAVSTVLSGLSALTLSPALCAMLLKKPKESTFVVFKYFNKYFEKLTNGYVGIVTTFLRNNRKVLLGFLVLTTLAFYGFMKWPTSFVPNEDSGYFMVSVQLPDGRSLNDTKKILADISENIIDSIDGINTYISINGYSMLDGSQVSNFGSFFVILEDWDDRTDESLSLDAIVQKYNIAANSLQKCISFAFAPPAISGLGTAGGFEYVLQDRNNVGTAELQKMANELCIEGNSQSGLSGLMTTFRANIPQLYVNIDRDKIKSLNLSMSDVFTTLSAYMGSAYVNDFIEFARTYQVKIQAEGDARATGDDVLKLTVKNTDGKMVPFSAFASIDPAFGPELLRRYNLYPSTIISGNAGAGKSSGEAIKLMEDMSDTKLGNAFSSEWTSMAYQEKEAGSTVIIIFALAILIVFLVLAAQYESWTSPLAVIMGLPIALLGVILGCIVTGLSISIYTQIGIVLLIALSAKNAILIVEFARDFRQEGKSIRQSSIDAARLRFRPILMTSFAFILGVFPLVIATGAGAASRVSLGVAVFSGMILSVVLGTMLIPNFYSLWQNIQEKYLDRKKEE